MTIHEKAAVGFQRAGDAYERGRPEYPRDAIEFLSQVLRIEPNTAVVDLGAGTGKFTKLLLQSGAKLTAVEPVEGMRKKFHSLLPGVPVMDGSAERMPLGNSSVDVVIAAQAFHWFDAPAALKEIHRVLKPGGRLAMIWNARDESVAWVSKLTEIIDPHEGGAPRYKAMKWLNAFQNTSLFNQLQLKQFSYIQSGTIETVVDRVASISFISALPEAKRAEVLQQVRELVLSHPDTKEQQEIHLPYRTDFFWCEKQHEI